jgi:hypothetical protein
MECEQLVDAARIGRADHIIALMAEGADMDHKDRWVRSFLHEFHICLFLSPT